MDKVFIQFGYGFPFIQFEKWIGSEEDAKEKREESDKFIEIMKTVHVHHLKTSGCE